MDWNPKWGDPADYRVDPERTELDGFAIGETVTVIDDDEDAGLFSGDEVEIVAIAHIEAGAHPVSRPTRDELIVFMDGFADPVGVASECVAHV